MKTLREKVTALPLPSSRRARASANRPARSPSPRSRAAARPGSGAGKGTAGDGNTPARSPPRHRKVRSGSARKRGKMKDGKTRVGLMGFGRIGRNVFRQLEGHPDIEVAAIVDIADPKALVYLLKYDSVFGRFHGEGRLDEGRNPAGDGRVIPM